MPRLFRTKKYLSILLYIHFSIVQRKCTTSVLIFIFSNLTVNNSIHSKSIQTPMKLIKSFTNCINVCCYGMRRLALKSNPYNLGQKID